MGTRPLSNAEAALWARVMAGVRPLRVVVPARAAAPAAVASSKNPPLQGRGSVEGGSKPPAALPTGRTAATKHQALPHANPSSEGEGLKRKPPPTKTTSTKTTPTKITPSNTLDGSWDRQLSRGLVSPDRTIDLHGHTLHSAYDRLDAALGAAIRAGDRVILLVTGKPPRPASDRPLAPNTYRGVIRAATGDWLAGSRHASAIAAVRGAHPRHGGAGALYIILKRPKISGKS